MERSCVCGEEDRRKRENGKCCACDRVRGGRRKKRKRGRDIVRVRGRGDPKRKRKEGKKERENEEREVGNVSSFGWLGGDNVISS
jgi:hypothetical protein